MEQRHLDWDACQNVRDLGGYPTADGGRTRWRALLRADTSCRLTPAGRAALVDYGVRTVLDLRDPAELARAPSPLAAEPDGLAYLNVPLEDGADTEYPALRLATDDLPTLYRLIVDRFGRRFAAAARAIADARPGGVVVHCHAGKDRTGLLVALVLGAVGVPAAALADDYALSDERLVRHYADELEDPALAPDRRERLRRTQHARPETMLATLAHVGPPDAYLRAHGLAAAELARLRDRLVDYG